MHSKCIIMLTDSLGGICLQTALAMTQTLVGDKGNIEFCFINKKGPALTQSDWDSKFEKVVQFNLLQYNDYKLLVD